MFFVGVFNKLRFVCEPNRAFPTRYDPIVWYRSAICDSIVNVIVYLIVMRVHVRFGFETGQPAFRTLSVVHFPKMLNKICIGETGQLTYRTRDILFTSTRPHCMGGRVDFLHHPVRRYSIWDNILTVRYLQCYFSYSFLRRSNFCNSNINFLYKKFSYCIFDINSQRITSSLFLVTTYAPMSFIFNTSYIFHLTYCIFNHILHPAHHRPSYLTPRLTPYFTAYL